MDVLEKMREAAEVGGAQEKRGSNGNALIPIVITKGGQLDPTLSTWENKGQT